ncbi:hypothetical protein CGRA01v4_09154 [Colletotrichum graminicola]|nr:hypothetical protein CGRA01v4_09154 [Colletotrichum graminicola]
MSHGHPLQRVSPLQEEGPQGVGLLPEPPLGKGGKEQAAQVQLLRRTGPQGRRLPQQTGSDLSLLRFRRSCQQGLPHAPLQKLQAVGPQDG